MTAPWWTGVVVILKLVSSAAIRHEGVWYLANIQQAKGCSYTRCNAECLDTALSHEASMTEPAICYILDGILLFYCLITTLLFFRAKCKSSPEPKEDPTHAELKPGANADDQQSAATRRKRKQETSSDTYQALQIKDDGNDDYQVIMSKGRKNKKAQVPQPLSAKTQTRATAPPLPPH